MSKEIRRSLIAKIKIAQKQLNIEDWEYRQMLERLTGLSSCAQMQNFQLVCVLNELKRKGFKPTVSKKHVSPNHSKSKDAMIGKVAALLADNKLPWDYAHSMAKRMFKVDRVEWLDYDHLHKLIAALQIYANRKV